MNQTVERYVIKHLTGSKNNQVEEFDFTKRELTIGRSADNTIQYDPELETIVSREHGRIARKSDNPLKFEIIDNNSRNSIFVNKSRVKGTAELHPGDQVQLGNNGPSFIFDIFPRPQDMMMATRVVEIPANIKATTVSEVRAANADLVPAEPVKTGLGKQTVERMLVSERKKSYSTMGIVIAAVVVVLAGLGYGFRDKFIKKETVVINNPAPVDSSKIGKKRPDEISAENDDKVVQIEFGWQLFDTRTNDELWHEYSPVKDANGAISYMPLYIANSKGGIEPYLKSKRFAGKGIPMSMTGASGSGFVVSEDGYILTNRHVAAGWHTSWSFPQTAFPGLMVKFDASGKEVVDLESRVMPENVGGWVPGNATMADGQSVSQGTIQGKNTYLNVVFSGTTERRMARLVQPSDDHDAALIKVDIPTSLSKVKMRDNSSGVAPGQAVTVMGYPGVAPQSISVRSSKDPFNEDYKSSTRPTPTVTPGSIGRIITGSSMKDMNYSGFGDSYQLTVPSGSGNSGGPLFDDEGYVIGIFYALAQDEQGTRVTFAVPIKYGLQLMGVGKNTGN